MVYYFLIVIATIFFSLQVLFNKKYLQISGDGLSSAIIFSLGTNATICIIMAIFNKGKIEFSLFSFLIAIVNAFVNIAFTYCTVRALIHTNISTYTMFTVSGGMLLPFIGGILIWSESLTIWKIICCLLILTALFLNTSRGNKKSDNRYYFFVFALNGLAGMLQKWHQSMSSVNISSTGYLMLYSFVVVIISAALLMLLKDKKVMPDKPNIACMAGFGMVNGLGTLIVLVSLVHLPASVQYPMVTGGVLIASTLLTIILREKIRKQSIAAVFLAFIAVMLVAL